MPRKRDDDEQNDGPTEVVISTEDGFAYYELSEEHAKAYEESRDTMQVLLNGKKVRQTKVTPQASEEVEV
jgi:hypothetical protein